MPKDMDDYEDLVEQQREKLEEQKEKRRREKEKRQSKLLEKWAATDEEDCSHEQSGTAIYDQYPVSLLLKRDDFEIETDADELWACQECGRIPSEDEIRRMGLRG
jgi:hypothetical protein